MLATAIIIFREVLEVAIIIGSLAALLWDISAVLSEQSALGMLLHTLIGYDSRPAGMQLIFYIAALVTIGIGMRLAGKNRPVQSRERAASKKLLTI